MLHHPGAQGAPLRGANRTLTVLDESAIQIKFNN